MTHERVGKMRSEEQSVPERILEYEPPRVERVLSPQGLDQEVLYAGVQKLSRPV